MDLNITNEISDKKQNNNEVADFINDLNTALNKKNTLNNNNLFNEILEEVELASKYKSKLQSAINKCLKDMSYERDFYYFDYDTRTQKYFLDYYCEGQRERFDLSNEEIKEYQKYGNTFYEPSERKTGHMIESDNLKDWMKYEVQSNLLNLDIKNRGK